MPVMTEEISKQVGKGALVGGAPLQRIRRDEEFMGAAWLFGSSARSHITGRILAVDGGVSEI